MMPSSVEHLPPATRARFELAFTNKLRPIGWGEPDDIAVGVIQAWLNALDIPLPKSTSRDLEGNIQADGIYGSETFRAIKKFQELNQLKPDGMVGENTLNKFHEKLHEKFTVRVVSNPPKNAAVTVKKRPFRCPPGTLICPEPP